jgi:hypothetical protein
MSESYVEVMRRRLHIRIVLSRMGCATYPHQDQISSDSCIVLLALHAGKGGVGQWRIKLLNPSYLGKEAYTGRADGDRAGAVFSSYTFPLPSDGDAAIATSTSVENACCLHGFEDAEMEKGQGEWRIMVQIGCQCPMHLQDIFLQHVRGFKAQEVPADWLEQLMAVGAEGLAGASSGSSHKGKGKGKMPAAADEDEDAAWEQEQEQFERARDASIRAAGSTGSSSSSGGSSSSEGAGQAASSRRASSRACRPRTGVAGASGVNYSRQ